MFIKSLMVNIQNAGNADRTEEEVGMPRMLSSTWSSARCSFDAILRMSSGGEGIGNGLDAMLGISSGVAMLDDFNSFETVYLFAQSNLSARCIYKPLRNSSAVLKGY